MANMISWFEIPVKDLDRAVLFYSTILEMQVPVLDLGPLKMGLLGDRTQGVAGALVQHGWYKPSENGALVYLNGGADLQEVLSRVEPAGGAVIVPKRQISQEAGYMAVFKDTEGNRVALHSLH